MSREPTVCPYNEFCPEYGTMETTQHVGYGIGVKTFICERGVYVNCPLYATQTRADEMIAVTNGVAGAMLRHLRDGELEKTIKTTIGGEQQDSVDEVE